MVTKCQFQLAAARLERSGCGPLGPHLDGFAVWLSEQGYATPTGMKKIGLAVFLSRWLERKGIGLDLLDENRVAEFCKSQREPLSRRTEVQHSIGQLLQYLRRSHVINLQRPSAPRTKADELLDEYSRFLFEERGLRPLTLSNYLPVVRHFLTHSFGSGAMLFAKLSGAAINKFILHEMANGRSGRVQLIATALRSFLGFLYLRGHMHTALAAAIPAVAKCRRSDLPQFLEPEQVRQILMSCCRSTPCGRRDYAVLLLMARLGMRSGEVVSLSLEDINWRGGEILIRGKSARDERLPLPSDVGRALVAYLRQGRPHCTSRRVFIRVRAPHEGFRSSVAIGDILRRALRRACIVPARKGTQLLRHSLATRMLQSGASLTQIGQILRHQLPQTTEIYAKVDFGALRAMAQPWPLNVK